MEMQRTNLWTKFYWLFPALLYSVPDPDPNPDESADPDPDPHQNVMDPEHCFCIIYYGVPDGCRWPSSWRTRPAGHNPPDTPGSRSPAAAAASGQGSPHLHHQVFIYISHGPNIYLCRLKTLYTVGIWSMPYVNVEDTKPNTKCRLFLKIGQ